MLHKCCFHTNTSIVLHQPIYYTTRKNARALLRLTNLYLNLEIQYRLLNLHITKFKNLGTSLPPLQQRRDEDQRAWYVRKLQGIAMIRMVSLRAGATGVDSLGWWLVGVGGRGILLTWQIKLARLRQQDDVVQKFVLQEWHMSTCLCSEARITKSSSPSLINCPTLCLLLDSKLVMFVSMYISNPN
jgi:hypothetical protein